ncbi:MAG: metallophosphoesterase [Bacteroidota bacterium]|nr:metallophosphoesterase [Bacteroidota bacterium]
MHSFHVNTFISIVIFIIVLDLYVWQAFRFSSKNLKPIWRKIIKYTHFGFSLLYIGLAAIVIFNSNLDIFYRNIIFGTFMTLYFTKLFVCIFLLIDDIRRAMQYIVSLFTKKKKPVLVDLPIIPKDQISHKISRSKFITTTGMIAGIAPLILMTRGVAKNAYNYQVIPVPLKLDKLPSSFRGLKILQISDIHSGSWANKDAVKAGVDLINSQKADLIFFTGDLVNFKTDEAYPWMDILSQIKAPMGVFSILGNHDYGDYYYAPDDPKKIQNMLDLYKVHSDMGWHLLRNEHVTLNRGGERIGIVGVENWGNKGRFPKVGDLHIANKNIPDVPVKLLLSHDPSHWEAKVKHEMPDADIMFAGHTHGGQFGIENKLFRYSPVQHVYKQWAGMYEHGKQKIYVNRGFGFIGFPGRVGILPEITVFELV